MHLLCIYLYLQFNVVSVPMNVWWRIAVCLTLQGHVTLKGHGHGSDVTRTQ